MHDDEVVRRVLPSALIGHATVLHDTGWITQIPTYRHVYALSGFSAPDLPGYCVHPRPQRWYDKAQDRIEHDDARGLPRVDPAYALADMIAWGELYGVTQSGELISIDPQTGASTTVHNFDHRWYGAASTPRRDERRKK